MFGVDVKTRHGSSQLYVIVLFLSTCIHVYDILWKSTWMFSSRFQMPKNIYVYSFIEYIHSLNKDSWNQGCVTNLRQDAPSKPYLDCPHCQLQLARRVGGHHSWWCCAHQRNAKGIAVKLLLTLDKIVWKYPEIGTDKLFIRIQRINDIKSLRINVTCCGTKNRGLFEL